MWRICIAVLLIGPTPLAAQDRALVDLATRTLASLQDISFRKQREYCGFLGYSSSGELVATPAQAGTRDSCSAEFPDDIAVIASFHTHGAFDDGYYNEVPSDLDLRSDAEFFLDGFVSTPGGRLWYVDGRKLETFQICGTGCLPVAPGFRKGVNGEIATHYTYQELLDLIGR